MLNLHLETSCHILLYYHSDLNVNDVSNTCQKNKDPNNASPSDAKMFFKSRKRKPGRKYKSNPDEINKKLVSL